MIDQTKSQHSTDRFVAQMSRDRYTAWRSVVESFKSIQGARASLEHVEEKTWAGHFAANEDAFSAVVAELGKIGD